MDKLAARNIRIAVALDGHLEDPVQFAKTLKDEVDMFKVHHVMERHGTFIITALAEYKPVFVDTKLDDTHRTVMLRVAEYYQAGARFCTVHAKEEGVKAAQLMAGPVLEIIVVTELTSVKDDPGTAERVLRKAQMALMQGVNNITCPGRCAETIRNSVNYKNMHCFIPGIEPSWGPKIRGQEQAADHRQVLRWAQRDFTYVLGRCVTESASPVDTVRRIRAELNSML